MAMLRLVLIVASLWNISTYGSQGLPANNTRTHNQTDARNNVVLQLSQGARPASRIDVSLQNQKSPGEFKSVDSDDVVNANNQKTVWDTDATNEFAHRAQPAQYSHMQSDLSGEISALISKVQESFMMEMSKLKFSSFEFRLRKDIAALESRLVSYIDSVEKRLKTDIYMYSIEGRLKLDMQAVETRLSRDINALKFEINNINNQAKLSTNTNTDLEEPKKDVSPNGVRKDENVPPSQHTGDIQYVPTLCNCSSSQDSPKNETLLEASNSNQTVDKNDAGNDNNSSQFKECKRGMAIDNGLNTSYVLVVPDEGDVMNSSYLCDTSTDGGGWVVIQRRTDGDVDFYRGWEDYKKGFGSTQGDFWMGNDQIHRLTNSGYFELRVELKYKAKSVFAHYNDFYIADESMKYALHLGKYDGTAGDSMKVHNGKKFSTYDADNDNYSRNCAKIYTGAWWFNQCHTANLNGKWMARVHKGPRWSSLSGYDPCTFTEMKVRKVVY